MEQFIQHIATLGWTIALSQLGGELPDEFGGFDTSKHGRIALHEDGGTAKRFDLQANFRQDLLIL